MRDGQVHFLARYWAEVRAEPWKADRVSEHYFPFISAERFTLLELASRPSIWFWFTREWEDLELPWATAAAGERAAPPRNEDSPTP